MNFQFPFYGNQYNYCAVMANGWIGFEATEQSWNNQSIFSEESPKGAILGFWDDLYPESLENDEGSGNIRYHSNNERLVVWYDNVRHWVSADRVYDFQIVLYADGRVAFNYRNMNGATNSSTIGIIDFNGDYGLEVLYNQDKIRHVMICKEPYKVGQIYGMWANALGLGGILPIQVRRVLDDTGFLLTGTQGDTMKESMKCAKGMAWELLYIHKPVAYQGFIRKKNEKKNCGLQVHCPATSTPKDGPSAGGAICIAIFSYLSKIPIKSNVAMTGEIDLRGNITAIGGLEAKLNGAKKAGIKTAIIPKENQEQLDRLIDQGKVIEDANFKVVMVETVFEAVCYFIE